MKAVDLQLKLRKELDAELRNHILEFWMAHAIDHKNGGFYGRVNRYNRPIENALKSAVLNGRILWTFAAAYRMIGDAEYRSVADDAFVYIEEKFWDKEYGGVYWLVNGTGQPYDRKKHNYAQAFALYGYSEYFRATGRQNALDRSIEIFNLMEKHCFDGDNNGYREAFYREWNLLPDAKLNDEDIVVKRSMNTHLHILEAFTHLYRIWPDKTLHDRLKMLIELFLVPMYDSKHHHLYPFFDEQWNVVDTVYSYGHDIEASWLLSEAANVMNNARLITATNKLAEEIAYSTLNEGVDKVNGGLFNSGKEGEVVDTDKQWWVQAEAIVGFFDAYQKTCNVEFLNAALQIWSYVKDKVKDHKYGDWFFMISQDGKPYLNEDKIGPWKCPYHTARACMEIMHRTEHILSPSE